MAATTCYALCSTCASRCAVVLGAVNVCVRARATFLLPLSPTPSLLLVFVCVNRRTMSTVEKENGKEEMKKEKKGMKKETRKHSPSSSMRTAKTARKMTCTKSFSLCWRKCETTALRLLFYTFSSTRRNSWRKSFCLLSSLTRFGFFFPPSFYFFFTFVCVFVRAQTDLDQLDDEGMKKKSKRRGIMKLDDVI